MRIMVQYLRGGKTITEGIPNVTGLYICDDSDGKPMCEISPSGEKLPTIKPESGFEHNIFGFGEGGKQKRSKWCPVPGCGRFLWCRDGSVGNCTCGWEQPDETV